MLPLPCHETRQGAPVAVRYMIAAAHAVSSMLGLTHIFSRVEVFVGIRSSLDVASVEKGAIGKKELFSITCFGRINN